MKACIRPSFITGSITASPSKSAMQRALALALLHHGTTVIKNPGISNDDLTAIEIIKSCGAIVTKKDQQLIIKSNGRISAPSTVNFGESGLSLRMFTPIIAMSDHKIVLNGSGSLLQRPVDFFTEVFPLINIQTSSNSGRLPVTIQGPLIPVNIEIDGSLSSQYLTGLLFAFAASVSKPTFIKVNNLKSRPYIYLSMQMLMHFGHQVTEQPGDIFLISPRTDFQENIDYFTEGDWSGAAFILVAGAICGNIEVKGLDIYSAQADRAVLDVLKSCGADLKVMDEQIMVSNANLLRAFHFDATHCPDLFPPLATLACYCEGTSVIKGVSRLAAKESDRAASLMDIFSKMGVNIKVDEDEMEIQGAAILNGASLHSHHDHRIAMAASVAALRALGDTSIENAEAVNKSYPMFWKHMESLGGNIIIEK
ncbi:MAG: 3-phosphoshikimate 1-carboxyvinyltransferase [Ferruginibacter sp.]